MTYNQNTPLPEDIPADSQDEFLTNFDLINQYFSFDHLPFGYSISAATLANPCSITSVSHGLTTGDNVTVDNLKGTQTNGVEAAWSINGNTYACTVVDDDTFTIPVDTSSEPTYISNTGIWASVDIDNGYHKKITFANSQTNSPDRVAPITSFYTKLAEEIAQLFFQNNSTSSDEYGLTGLEVQSGTDENNVLHYQRAFKTPWGFTINTGYVNVPRSFFTYALKIPYNTAHFATVASAAPLPLQGQNVTAVNIDNLTISSFDAKFQGAASNEFDIFRRIYYVSIGV